MQGFCKPQSRVEVSGEAPLSPLTIDESMVDCQRSLNFAGWRRGQSRHAHNVKIGGSNPSPAKFPLDNRRKHGRLSTFFQ